MAKHDRLQLLVNNAGLILGKRIVTADGLEAQFVTNYLSHFLLTNLLLPTLQASAPSRIVNVSSSVHYQGHMHFDDLLLERGYSAIKAYCQSKLAQRQRGRECFGRDASHRDECQVRAILDDLRVTQLELTVQSRHDRRVVFA